MAEFWDDVLAFAKGITATVGERLLQDFGQVNASEKEDGSLVTRSDCWADETICAAIAKRFPDHGILSEENSQTFPGGDWCWVIDPLDGTTNFARGVPVWAISMALLYQGTPVFGYIALPPLHQAFHGFWYGSSGLTGGPTGAFCNDRPICTSTAAPGSNQFFSLCSRSFPWLQRESFPCKIRMLGVASYNFLTVAAGITLGGIEATPKIWDIAAVWAILQAAGGSWIPLDSTPLFPLEVGDNYQVRSFPTLVVNQAQYGPQFQQFIQIEHSSILGG